MDHDFALAMSCLVGTIILYTWLAYHNYKELIKTKHIRIAARRIEKKEKTNDCEKCLTFRRQRMDPNLLE